VIILDTNVISEAFRPRPNVSVQTWLDSRRQTDFFLCTPVLAELRYGVERLPYGQRRTELDKWITEAEQKWFATRILALDRAAAYEFGRVVAKRASIGRPIMPMDALIAAIAISHHMAIATRDVEDFAHLNVELVNPFDPSIVP
jgi:predicted nucleic acid-binding protein